MTNVVDTKKYELGGWYEGRQWNGQALGAPGVINLPGQQGYGQPVSNEVVAQTNPANVDYLKQQTQQYQPTTANVGATGLQPATSLDDIYGSPELKAANAEIDAKTKAYNEAQAKINDNPFYSEATRVGKSAKLQQIFNAEMSRLQDTAKRLSSEAEFKYNASVKAGEVRPQTVTDDYGNVTIIDTNTGNIIKQIKGIGNVQGTEGGGGGGVTKATITSFNTDADTVDWSTEQDDKGNPVHISPFMKLVIKYAPKMSLSKIYELYSNSSLGKNWGDPTEDKEMITALYNQARGL